jgi:hypothetical protein
MGSTSCTSMWVWPWTEVMLTAQNNARLHVWCEPFLHEECQFPNNTLENCLSCSPSLLQRMSLSPLSSRSCLLLCTHAARPTVWVTQSGSCEKRDEARLRLRYVCSSAEAAVCKAELSRAASSRRPGPRLPACGPVWQLPERLCAHTETCSACSGNLYPPKQRGFWG